MTPPNVSKADEIRDEVLSERMSPFNAFFEFYKLSKSLESSLTQAQGEIEGLRKQVDVDKKTCVLSQDDAGSSCWESSCGAAWYFEEDPDPAEHKFCARCGNPTNIEPWVDEEPLGRPDDV